MRIARCLALLSLTACGASEVEPAHPVSEPTLGVVDPSDPDVEIDAMICESAADCMLGTPRDCCTNSCPSDGVAWSRAGWAAYQEECAIVECAVVETLACLDEDAPDPTVACVERRCVLVR